MPRTLKALSAALIIGVLPAIAAPAVSAQTVSGLPQATVQTQLGSCNLQLWLRHVGYRVDRSVFPANARFLGPWDAYRTNDDLSRVTVSVDARGIIHRINCG